MRPRHIAAENDSAAYGGAAKLRLHRFNEAAAYSRGKPGDVSPTPATRRYVLQ